MTAGFSLADYRLHNSATVEGHGPIVVSTPAERWAYALEFPRSTEPLEGRPVAVTVELTVLDGVVGIGCADRDGAFIAERERSAADGATRVEFTLPSLEACRAVIVRNTSPAHRASRVAIAAIGTSPVSPEALAPLHEIHLDMFVFEGLTPWSGVTPAGFTTDWLGVRTRGEVLPHIERRPVPNIMERRHESPGLRIDGHSVLEWTSLLEAVHAAGETFVVVELGAGWGPWMSAGALAARRTGRSYRLVGVEPEPTHFRWLARHLDDNAVDRGRCRLIEAAASGDNGVCWLLIGDPREWYGQSIWPDAAVTGIDSASIEPGTLVEVNGRSLLRTRTVDLETVLADVALVDYMHLDIQGAEVDVLAAHPQLLQERVKMVSVATHAESIERDLRRLFTSLGWRPGFDLPVRASVLVHAGSRAPVPVDFTDGQQVWVNPRLGRESARS